MQMCVFLNVMKILTLAKVSSVVKTLTFRKRYENQVGNVEYYKVGSLYKVGTGDAALYL